MQHQTSTDWWKTTIIYEVYLRSFKDSNGDGVGDLPGVIEKLPYLKELGVGAIWLTPFYPSPMKDFGYDISDYENVHPVFGTLSDFDELVRKAHEVDIKLIVDFVPNHTSDAHPWFRESLSSRDHPKRNWYYWKDARPGGGPPNNWLSVLGGSAWKWDENTGQYYYHAFLEQQPDLNLNHPAVLEQITNVMRFWMDRGVDGFRIDVMWHLLKDPRFRDNPVNPEYKSNMPDCDRLAQVFSCDQPEVHDIIARLRKIIDERPGKVMIGELYLPVSRIIPYYGSGDTGAQLPANFSLMFTQWRAEHVSLAIAEYEAALPEKAWPNWVMGNHDRPRLVSRIGEAQARVAAMLLLTLRGTPTLYYGDEIGMEQVRIPKEAQRDPQGILMPGKNLSRDPQRTPMQWDATPHSGFTSGKPWLPMAKDGHKRNVERQQRDPDSLLSLYKRLIRLRTAEPALHRGDYFPRNGGPQVVTFFRACPGHASFLIALNLTGKSASYKPDTAEQGTIVVCTNRKMEGSRIKGKIRLRAHEGMVIKIDAQ